RTMIRLTKHAVESIEKRNLDLEWIERTLASPDFTRHDPRDRTLTRSFKAIAETGGRIMRVVHRAEGNDIVGSPPCISTGAPSHDTDQLRPRGGRHVPLVWPSRCQIRGK